MSSMVTNLQIGTCQYDFTSTGLAIRGGGITANTSGEPVTPVAGQVSATHLAPVTVLVTTKTVTASESGTTFFLDLAGGFVTTLPAVAAGLHYRFVVKTAPSGGAYTIVCPAAAEIIVGMSNSSTGGNGDSTAGAGDAATTVTFADGSALKGDWVDVICDGTNWYVNAFMDADAGITFTG